MNTDKKQTIQIIILGVLAAVICGVVVFQMVGKKPTQTAKKSAEVSQASSQEARAETTEEPGTESLDMSAVPSGSRRDPFAPAFTAETEHAKPQMSRSSSNPVMGKIPPVIPGVGLPSFGASPRSGNPAGGIAGLSGAPEAPKTFIVTGVVVGERNVAIIHSDSGDRQVVREGQYVGGRYKVLSITKAGVVIKGDGQKIYIRLGGVKNAS